jgi:dihydroorotate dehydrogenase (fumarate)
MVDLTTKYLGLTLQNPIVIGSSGLTDNIDNIVELEKAGAGAVVLKSIFEEEIMLEAEKSVKEAEENGLLYSQKSESLDYIDMHIKEDTLSSYVELIREAKDKVLIPVIASVNCTNSGEWINFSKQLQDAGADALELNIAVLPSDVNMSAEDVEQKHFQIIQKVKERISIPVVVKLSSQFANLAQFIKKISETGISGMVLFNRFYSPDIDINNYQEKAANTYSLPNEFTTPLRWIAIMSDKIDCSLAAATGIHEGKTVIKQLLAGADVVQVVSALYKHGPGHIQTMLKEVEEWMKNKGYNYIDQYRGKMSSKKQDNAAYERIQFMKYFSRIG